jgi:hypothetical protein
MKQPRSGLAGSPHTPMPPAPKPEKPWYRTAGWWEGLSNEQIWGRIKTIDFTADAHGFVSVPRGFLQHLGRYQQSAVAVPPQEYRPTGLTAPIEPTAPESMTGVPTVADRAWMICMELVRRDGYSTQHVERAWTRAAAFERAEQEKRSSAAATTTNEGGQINANAG